jgi:Mg2+-importing ATPase
MEAAPADSLSAPTGGLTTDEAASRLTRYGRNELGNGAGHLPIGVLAEQFRSPFVIILLAAAALSFGIGEMQEGVIIAAIVLASSVLGFFQEYRAANTVAALRARLRNTASVLRDGETREVPASEIVPGDVVLLRAGSMVPADGIALEANSLHVDEAPLTGESFPAAKIASPVGQEPPQECLLHMGTSVRSGTGRMLVRATGATTQYGTIARHADRLEPETSFARGVRRFGLLMTQTMAVIVLVILPVNLLLGRPIVDSVLFAAALAVGLTPELLPAIVTVTLSRGARQLAAAKVLIRRLVAIEYLGAMDVLCTDKTGTLTEGVLSISQLVDGRDGSSVVRWARINVQYQAGLDNPLDQALLAGTPPLAEPISKLGELPYDFERKCLSVAVACQDGAFLVCKGAVPQVLEQCSHTLLEGEPKPLDAARRLAELAQLQQWSSKGTRAIAVAIRPLPGTGAIEASDETGLTLVGYVLFEDRVKAGAADVVARLKAHGVRLKIVSGDNRHVAAYVAEAIGLASQRVLTGDEILRLSSRALARRLLHTDVFAEVTPDQKERIIEAYRRLGKVVGYLGDGINDAPVTRGRSGNFGRQCRRRGTRGGGRRAARARPACPAQWHRYRSGVLRQYAEIRGDHHQRQSGQHGEHGARLDVPALSATAGQTDPHQQLPVGSAAACRFDGRGGRWHPPAAGTVGFRPAPALDALVRRCQHRLRYPDIRSAALAGWRQSRCLPDRVVHRVAADRGDHHLRHANEVPGAGEPTEQLAGRRVGCSCAGRHRAGRGAARSHNPLRAAADRSVADAARGGPGLWDRF